MAEFINIRVNNTDVEWMRQNIPGSSDIDRFWRMRQFYENTYGKPTVELILKDLKEIKKRLE